MYSTIGEGLKNKIVLHSFRKVKWNQAYTVGIFHEVYEILRLQILMTVNSLAVSFEEARSRQSEFVPHKGLLSICYSIMILNTLS